MAPIDSQDPRFLTGTQQHLLRTALASNNPKQKTQPPGTVNMSAITNPSAISGGFADPEAFSTFDPDDPLLANFYDGDTSFDLDNTDLSGVYPGDIESNDIHDKRKASDASDDSEEGDPKRREGEDKQAKKPGRKPLTTEPTTKRKAQNRAAQRAFRERKEKHLKDLETKVAEMTKESQADKQENGLLRAQVDRLQSELKEYRNRLASDSSRGQTGSTYKPNTRSDFTFQFPAFGSLPGASSQFFGSKPLSYVKRESGDMARAGAEMPDGEIQQISPGHPASAGASPPTNQSNGTRSPSSVHASNSMQSFAGLFSPGLLNGAAAAVANSPDYGFPRTSQSPASQPLKETRTNSSGADRVFRLNSEPASSNTDSPSQSSLSQFNATSSCGTSPALSQHPSPPKNATPGANPGLTSINESSTADPLSIDSIDWLVSQNGGQFDPVLFGDYRESQEAIVGDGDFNNGFFNEAFPFDLSSPLTLTDTISPKPTFAPMLSKTQSQDKPETARQLLAEVDKTQAGYEEAGLPKADPSPSDSGCPLGLVKPGTAGMLSANAIWNQLQSNKDFQDGIFDLDSLCTELRSKAKCSESGMAVSAGDVEATFKKLSAPNNKPSDHSLIFEEAVVNDTLARLSSTTTSNSTWGGFGLTNEQLSQGW